MTTGTTQTPARQATTLGQIVALVGGAKARTEQAVTGAYHAIQRTPQMNGISRRYQPRDDEGEQLPPEQTRVQVRAEDAIDVVTDALTRLLDLTATQDEANTRARADIVVGGRTLVPQVPVTTLMWLEKRLGDLRTFVGKLPTLDPAETWHRDDNAEAWATETTVTTRTKKIPRNHVKAEATDRHAAQVDVWMEDVVVGDWRTVKYSGALPAAEQRAYAARVEQLLDAVRAAREACNTVPVEDVAIGDALLGYVFG